MPRPPISAAKTPSNAAGFAPIADDVFGRIAGRYDLLCDLFSFGLHRLWKRAMAARMARHDGAVILDVASGTGDIPLRLLRCGGAPKELRISDISPRMLAIAERKVPQQKGLSFVLLDGENCPETPSGSIDVVSISFGMKICDRTKVACEALRVLKPGGKFYCLEAARIPAGWLHKAYLAYMGWCLPLIGRIAARGDASAYVYLLRGVREFPDQATFARELEAVGFEAVTFRSMSMGIVALHEARKPLR